MVQRSKYRKFTEADRELAVRRMMETDNTAHGVQHGGKFLSEHQETAIAWLLAAENGDEAARGKTRAG